MIYSKFGLNGTQYKDVKWGMEVESAHFHGIVNGESLCNIFCCLLCTFYCQTTPILKTLGQFENLVFVIMSTRENIRLIARTSSCTSDTAASLVCFSISMMIPSMVQLLCLPLILVISSVVISSLEPSTWISSALITCQGTQHWADAGGAPSTLLIKGQQPINALYSDGFPKFILIQSVWTCPLCTLRGHR